MAGKLGGVSTPLDMCGFWMDKGIFCMGSSITKITQKGVIVQTKGSIQTVVLGLQKLRYEF